MSGPLVVAEWKLCSDDDGEGMFGYYLEGFGEVVNCIRNGLRLNEDQIEFCKERGI
jgi:hypothetical protein